MLVAKPSQLSDCFFDRKLDSEYDFVHQFPRGFPTLAERYTKCREEIHIHLTVGGSKYCAVFYRPIVDKAASQFAGINGEGSQVNTGRNQVEVPVLLDVSKTIEKAEKIVRTFRTLSAVRLQHIDACPNPIVHPGQLVGDPASFPVARVSDNRESGSSGWCSVIGDDQILREMVQHAPKVKEGISEPKGDTCGRYSGIALDAPSVLQTFTLEIMNNYARIGGPKRGDFLPKGLHLIVRPYLLGLKTAEHRPDNTIREARGYLPAQR